MDRTAEWGQHPFGGAQRDPSLHCAHTSSSGSQTHTHQAQRWQVLVQFRAPLGPGSPFPWAGSCLTSKVDGHAAPCRGGAGGRTLSLLSCSAIAGLRGPLLGILKSLGNLKMFGEFIYCFLACQGAKARKKEEGSGVGWRQGVGTENKMRRETDLGKEWGHPTVPHS